MRDLATILEAIGWTIFGASAALFVVLLIEAASA